MKIVDLGLSYANPYPQSEFATQQLLHRAVWMVDSAKLDSNAWADARRGQDGITNLSPVGQASKIC
jgi:hypothetical protein